MFIYFVNFQASNAVGVLCQTEESKEVAKEIFSNIFCTLILRIGVSVVIDSTKKPLCVRYVYKSVYSKAIFIHEQLQEANLPYK